MKMENVPRILFKIVVHRGASSFEGVGGGGKLKNDPKI